MGWIDTENYQCLEVFAKATGQSQGMVVVADKAGHTAEYPAGIWQYQLIKIPLKENTQYDVRLVDCEVSICYLSESKEILDKGVLFLEWKEEEWIVINNLADWYGTPGREQYHFNPYKNWMNDPNGLCWYKEFYHMYYQANPHDQKWDHMYWGHAASRDLVHWVHLPYALEPQSEILNANDKKGGAFSGSAVVLDDKIRLYLTRHFGPLEDSEKETVQYQTMVESNDSIHFGEEKVIIKKPDETFSFNFRDPKVIWNEGLWQMVIGTKINEIPSIVLYQSADGFKWDYRGVLLEERTDGVYTFECPDIFLLNEKMVLTGAWMFYSDENRRFQPTYYYIGSYQQGEFQLEQKGLYDFGGNFYAVQSFEHENRRIAIGWISDFYNEHCLEQDGSYGSMAIPRELSVRNGMLYQRPIKEIYQLLGKCFCNISGQNICLKHLNHNAYYAKIIFSADTDFEIQLGKKQQSEMKLVKNGSELMFVMHGVRSHYVRFSTELSRLEKLEIFADHRLVEVFANDGERAGAKLFYGEHDGLFDADFADEESVTSIQVYEMKGIWR